MYNGRDRGRYIDYNLIHVYGIENDRLISMVEVATSFTYILTTVPADEKYVRTSFMETHERRV